MSDQETIDVEAGERVKAGDGTYANIGNDLGALDRAARSSRPRESVKKARTGLALPAAPSQYAAMREGGYSHWAARKPAEIIGSPADALAAAERMFPDEPTNRTIKQLSTRGIVQRLADDPSDQLLVTAYKVSTDVARDSGENTDEERDLQAAAAHADYNVHVALQRLELAQEIAAPGTDVPALLEQLQADLKAATEEQAAFHLTHGRKAQR